MKVRDSDGAMETESSKGGARGLAECMGGNVANWRWNGMISLFFAPFVNMRAAREGD
jgi:hypothetical protein